MADEINFVADPPAKIDFTPDKADFSPDPTAAEKRLNGKIEDTGFVDQSNPEQVYKPEDHPVAEVVANRVLATMRGAGIPTTLEEAKSTAKFLIRSPLQDVQEIYKDVSQIPERIRNLGKTVKGSPAAAVVRDPLSPQSFETYGTVAGMLLPAAHAALKGKPVAPPIEAPATLIPPEAQNVPTDIARVQEVPPSAPAEPVTQVAAPTEQAPPPPVVAKAPKLLSGEKQGDLISSTQSEPFQLVGEEGIDLSERARRLQAQSQAAEMARMEMEHRQELLSDFQDYQKRGGDELLDAVESGGGLPAISSSRHQFSGELQNIRDAYRTPSRTEKIPYAKVFRRDAPDIDALTQHLKGRGFNVDTPSDTLDLIENRIRTGQPVYGMEAKGVDLPEDAFASIGFTTPLIPGLGQLKTIGQRLNLYRKSFQTMFRAMPTRDKVSATYDAIENQSAIAGQQAESTARLAIGGSDMDRQAITPIIESLGDRSKLIADATKVVNSPKASPEMKRVYQYATTNFDRLTGKRDAINAIHQAQLDSEHLHGINTDEVEGYVAHRYDMDLMTPGKPLILDARGGKGGSSAYFKKQRVFPDYASAISEGYVPRTLDATKLVNNRVRAGQTLVNQRQWINAMRNEKSPIDGNPLVTDMIRQPKGTFVAPRGYVPREPVNGVRIAVNENFAPLIDALTGVSHVPKALKNLAGGIKHGVLLWDTFHASRLGQMQSAFMGRVGPTYRRGLSLLEYKDADLDAAVKANEITVEAADYARANRPTLTRLTRAGLNVGGISDALFKDAVESVPIAGRYSKWLFNKFNRGVIAESGIYAHERNARIHPNWSDAELDRNTAKEVNTYYRNLRSQGIFKSRTWQDAARVTFLAPQWVEGMVASELKGYGQMLKVPYDAATKGQFVVGNVAKGMGTGLLAYMAAGQLINFLTRGHPTWDNPEQGQKWSAWLPDFLGSSKGYFLNPMSVFAEMTHDMMKYSESNPNAIDVGTKIASNKFSPLTRAFHDVAMGKDFYGRPLDGVVDRVKQASIDLLPIPIGARSLSQQYAGSQQRTLASSMGLKLDVAPAPIVQMNERAKDFNREHGIRPHDSMPSEYRALKSALRSGNMDEAKTEYQKLLKAKSASTIRKYFEQQSHSPFTGSRSRESQFRNSLPREQQEIYSQAQTDEKVLEQRFNQLLR